MLNNRIFISAGDLSGDMHASNLVGEIKKVNPLCRIFAIGGDNLKMVADEFLEDIVNINAFGFMPIKQIFYLKRVFKKLKSCFVGQKPDKIILVDYYGFHIFVARLAKKLNVPVYYFISPQVWASRDGRIKKLAGIVKKMLVIFPFEEKLYKDSGVDAIFVGNPLVDTVRQKQNFKSIGFSFSNPPTVGLFPGSRLGAIKRHTPILLKTAKILREKINAKFIMFNTKAGVRFDLPDYIKLETSIDFEKRKLIDFAICPSGTVSLENALMAVPMATIYKLSYFNYFFIKAIIKVKYITMVNILSGKMVIKEFLQFAARPEKIALYALEQLSGDNYMRKVKELLAFRTMMGIPGVNKRAAEIILND